MTNCKKLTGALVLLLSCLLLRSLFSETERANAQSESPLLKGRFETIKGETDVVIAAPHADSDLATGDIVKTILDGKPFGGVIAWGFRNGSSWKDRFNVNRPTEKAGIRCDREVITQEARVIYDEYRRNISLASPSGLSLLVEIHGNSTQKQIEISTVRVTSQEASRLKKAYERVRNRHLKEMRNYPSIEVLIEPLNRIKMVAKCAKTKGIFRKIDAKVIHIELPREARTGPGEEIYVDILGEFIEEAAQILVD